MALFWVTFRIEESGNADARRRALDKAVQESASGKFWPEPTSFYLFESDLGIDALAAYLKRAIDEDMDVVLIGMPHVKSARVIGSVDDDDLFELLDFVKRA